MTRTHYNPSGAHIALPAMSLGSAEHGGAAKIGCPTTIDLSAGIPAYPAPLALPAVATISSLPAAGAVATRGGGTQPKGGAHVPKAMKGGPGSAPQTGGGFAWVRTSTSQDPNGAGRSEEKRLVITIADIERIVYAMITVAMLVTAYRPGGPTMPPPPTDNHAHQLQHPY